MYTSDKGLFNGWEGVCRDPGVCGPQRYYKMADPTINRITCPDVFIRRTSQSQKLIKQTTQEFRDIFPYSKYNEYTNETFNYTINTDVINNKNEEWLYHTQVMLNMWLAGTEHFTPEFPFEFDRYGGLLCFTWNNQTGWKMYGHNRDSKQYCEEIKLWTPLPDAQCLDEVRTVLESTIVSHHDVGEVRSVPNSYFATRLNRIKLESEIKNASRSRLRNIINTWPINYKLQSSK